MAVDADAGGPARPYVSWASEEKRHAPVPVRPHLYTFSASFALADALAPQSAATTAQGITGFVARMCTANVRPGSDKEATVLGITLGARREPSRTGSPVDLAAFVGLRLHLCSVVVEWYS